MEPERISIVNIIPTNNEDSTQHIVINSVINDYLVNIEIEKGVVELYVNEDVLEGYSEYIKNKNCEIVLKIKCMPDKNNIFYKTKKIEKYRGVQNY